MHELGSTEGSGTYEWLTEEERTRRFEEASSEQETHDRIVLDDALWKMEQPSKQESDSEDQDAELLGPDELDVFHISQEERESPMFANLRKSADNVFQCFSMKRHEDGRKGDNLVVVTDSGVPAIVQSAFLEKARDVAGSDVRVYFSKKPESSAQPLGKALGNLVNSATHVLFLTSKSRTHSPESAAMFKPSDNPEIEGLQRQRQGERASMFPNGPAMFSITRANNLELLTEGASQENLPEMWERIDRTMAVFKDAVGARITTELGTDLTVAIKNETIEAETGRLDKSGNIANFPFGEVACCPAGEGTNGVLIVDGVGGKAGATTNRAYLSRPIKVTIENGRAVKMEPLDGDPDTEARDFWEYLQQRQEVYDAAQAELPEDERKPGDAFKSAEFAFGMNAAAWLRDEHGNRILPPTQLAAEKALGTIHWAFGNNGVLLELGHGKGAKDPDYNPISTIHADQVVTSPTVVVTLKDGAEVTLMDKGELQV